MKRLAGILLVAVLCTIGTGTLSAEALGTHNTLGQDVGGTRTTYSLDSLFFHGSGGATDQDFAVNETISVVAVLSSGVWHATAPIDEVALIPNTNNPPDGAGADLDNYYSYVNGDASNITITGDTRLTFDISAPASWESGDQTFTLYLDGNCTGLHQAASSETYASIAGANVMHSGTETLTNAGFTIGDMELDTTSPSLVTAGCYATSLTTVRIQLDEGAQETGGDCGGNFELTLDGISGTILGSTLTSSTETVWTLTLASSLPDRDWQGTILYDRDNSANVLEDASANEIADGNSAVTTTEHIAPANPTMTAPTSTTDLSGSDVDWTGTADNSTTDPSMASVALQGSINGSSWTTLNTDSNTTDGNYAGAWTIGTEYNYYRLLASDDQGNNTASSSSIDYQIKQRLALTGTVAQDPDTYEDIITATITDAYGNSESGTHTISLTKASGSGNVTFRTTPAGSNVSTVDIVSGTNATFYMASDDVGSHEVRAATAGLVADTLACSITAGTASKLLVELPGQSFVDGTGITGTPTSWSAGGGIDFFLHIVDANNFKVSETSTRTINFASTAQNSPRNYAPRIDGVISTSWSGRSIDFTGGTSEMLAANFYDADGGTITATDPDGSPALTGDESSTQTINPREPDNLVFSLDNGSSESAVDWTGTNTVTARDIYGNTDTDFDASTYNVTVTSSGGTLDIASRGDAILDLSGDFTSGVSDLTTLGVNLTASSGTYTIDGTIAGVVMDAPNGTDTKDILVNAPTLSNASPAWRTHVNAEASSPGYMLQADCDEDGESLKVFWAFDNDSTKYSGFSELDSATVVTSSGQIQKYLTGSAINTMGDGYDYMFWWVGGTDAQGNAPEGKPISSNRLVYLVNPTLTVLGNDVANGFPPNTTNNEITQIVLSAEMPGAEITITRVDFSKTSTSNATTTHVSGFKLWRDVNSNGVYDSGTDVQIGSATGTVNPSFTSLSEAVINGSPAYLLLTVDISPSATVEQTIGMELTSDNVFVLQDNVDDVYPSGGSWPQPAAAGDYTLPVEISLFEANADYGQNHLNWRTESEQNSLGFIVWRAPALDENFTPPAELFEAVADWNLNPGLGAQENSSSATDYDYMDRGVEAGQLYCYRLESVDLDGSREFYEQALFVESLERPTDYVLESNVPNPFNPVTQIGFVLPTDGVVELSVYNLLGEKVRTLVSGEMSWGHHQVRWDGTNASGMQVASGTYFYRLQAPGFSDARRMLLLK